MIPYEDNVVLRAPLAPGGIHSPLVGREKLRNIWWPPMPQILGEVKLLDIYYNETLTGVMGEAEVEVTNPRLAASGRPLHRKRSGEDRRAGKPFRPSRRDQPGLARAGLLTRRRGYS